MATTPLRDHVRQAEAELAAHRPAEAARRCDRLLAVNPRWLDVQLIKAESLIALGRYPEALQLLDGVLGCNPELPRAFVARARATLATGDQLGALACFRRACELAPNDEALRLTHNQLAAHLGRAPYSPSHTGLARLHLRSDLLAHALREWDTALHANPTRLDAQIGIAETLWRMGDYARARDVCRSILASMPYCLKPLLVLAFCAMREGRRDEAQRLVRAAGELDPDYVMAGELFADLVASGDAELAQLFRSTARALAMPLLAAVSAPAVGPTTGPYAANPTTGPYAAGPATSPHAANPTTGPHAVGPTTGPYAANPTTMRNGAANPPGERPSLLPTGQLPTGPLFRPPPPPQETLAPTSKLNGDLRPVEDPARAEAFFSQSRASRVPEDFGRIFEREGPEQMLWGRESDDPTAELGAVSGVRAPPGEPPPSRAEIDFVRWLQSQGAQPLPAGASPAPPEPSSVAPPPFLLAALRGTDDAPAPPAGTTPPAPSANHAPPADQGAPPSSFSARPAPPEPSPYPGQTAPQASPSDPIITLAWPTAPTEPPPEPLITPPPPTPAAAPTRSPDPPPAPPPTAAAWSPESAIPATDAAPARTPEPPAPPPAEPAVPPAAPAPTALTIEGLEQGLASVGFARLDTGRLSTVASMIRDLPAPDAVPAASPQARLAAARDLRSAGRLGEALGEYRLLVKQTTDELPEVIRDLRDTAIVAPQEPEVYRLLGDAYMRLGQYEAALDAYNQAAARQTEGA